MPTLPSRFGRLSWKQLGVVILLLGIIGWSVFQFSHYWRANRHWRAAEEALDKHDLPAARAHLLLCFQLRPDYPDAAFMLGRIARRLALDNEALAYYRRCEELGGVPEALNLERTLLAVQNGDVAKAETQLRGYIENQHPDRLLILEALAKGYMKSFRLKQAVQSLERLLEEQPTNRLALFWYGQALYRFQRFREAREAYNKLLEVDPENEDARLAIGNLLLDSAMPLQAQEHFDWLCQRKPGSLEALQGRARALWDMGKREEARTALDALLERNALLEEALALRGKMEIALGQPAQALPWLRKALDLAPYHREAVYNMALCLRQLNQAKEAETWFARLKRIDEGKAKLSALALKIMDNPNDASLRCQAGEVFLEGGNEKEGLRWLASALQVDPHHQPTHRFLSQYYRTKGRLDLADLHARKLKSNSGSK